MAVVTALAVSIVAAVLVAEIKAWGPWVIRSLIKFAVRRLPEDQRARFDEEWQSYVNEIPGQIGKLVAAAGFLIAAYDSALNGVRQRMWAPLLAQLDDLESTTRAFVSAIQIDETLLHIPEN